MLQIRPEGSGDAPAIDAVHLAAFPTDAEARLVRRLRESGHATISLVAEREGKIVGHILFSPVTLESGGGVRAGLGLAPLAVLPEEQNQGVGTALVQAGLAECDQEQCLFSVVLGHPKYYSRFGYQRASTFGLANEYGADEAFMVRVLLAEALGGGGLVRYGAEFREFGPDDERKTG